jgi:hypothetical protein
MAIMDITAQIMKVFKGRQESWGLASFMEYCKCGPYKLRTIVPSNGKFGIVRYVKEQSDFTLPETPYFRSVVFEKDTGKIVSVAPRKSVSPVNDWKQPMVGDWSAVERMEEFIDGTMINIFQLAEDPTIYISTRSRVGGNTTFYEGGPTFETMLRDACPSLNTFFEGSAGEVHSRFASLVLQHPANRIVVPIQKPAMYVVQAGVVNQDGTIWIDNETFADYRPPVHDLEKAKTVGLHTYLRNLEANEDIKTQGIVIYMKDGTRARYRTRLYERVRRLRGNESLTYERFARLRREAAIEKYLPYYPEEKEAFYQLEGRLRSQTRTLFHMYLNVFAKRTQKYEDCPWPFKHHVSVLHNLYKETLKAQNKKIDLNYVINYTNKLSQEDMNNLLKNVKPKIVETWVKPPTDGLRDAPPLPDE